MIYLKDTRKMYLHSAKDKLFSISLFLRKEGLQYHQVHVSAPLIIFGIHR
jgi:hypothetical protein